MVLWLFPPHLLCRSKFHFYVCCFNLWCLLWILHHHCNQLCICCYIHIWFMWHIFLWFNNHLIFSALNTLIYSDLSSMILLLCSILLFLIWSAWYNTICLLWSNTLIFTHSDMIWFNMILSDLIWSIIFDQNTILLSNPLYSNCFNPIQYYRFLFPSLLFLLRSS